VRIESQPSTPPPSAYWIWALSIGISALVIAIFFPIFLIVTAVSIIVMGYLLAGASKHRDALSDELDTNFDDSQQALYIADLLRGLINAADIPILATDEHGLIAHINQQATSVLGIGQSLLGRRFDEIMTQGVLHELESLARAHEPGHARLTLPIKGEVRDFDVSADPVPISKGAVITFRDITELSRAMTLKTDFVANASHELRTPIASIKVAVETLSGPAKDDPQMSSRLIEMIANNADRLELLADDLLDLSKAESEDQSVQIELVNVHELVSQLLDGFSSPASRKNLELIAEIEPGIEEIATDSSLIALILRNLVQNAIKFAHEGTAVRVLIRASQVFPLRESPVPAKLGYPMGIELSVVDRGMGIPIAHQQRIFERFYQVDAARAGSGARRGTGLGLAIVKHAAKSLGGTIRIESAPQIGTTMCVRLPRCLDQYSADEVGTNIPNH
tara:strand:- start:667457 stop:668803 length:1347 start_codon:yes stop_codon:yes gene_type:complete